MSRPLSLTSGSTIRIEIPVTTRRAFVNVGNYNGDGINTVGLSARRQHRRGFTYSVVLPDVLLPSTNRLVIFATTGRGTLLTYFENVRIRR